MLELVNITKRFAAGGVTLDILKGANLTLPKGQQVAIVGPSGSGKSTLLHIAGLLDSPTSGEVKLDGKVVSTLSDNAKAALRSKTFGFVYQYHHLLPEFTALENVMMPARIAGRTEPQRAKDLLARVGLSERLGHFPTQLSGGEQQRVALARALMNKPAVLFADEPTGNLDPATAGGVFDLFHDLAATDGLTVLLVTHNEALAARCSAAYRMNGGHLESVG
jgi:lipoprotein-releasing system ATP-binding protein